MASRFAPWLVAAVAALAACTTTTATNDGRAVEASNGKPPITKSEVAEASRPPPQNECQAASYQYLLGKKKSDIPQQPAGAIWRIACTACPVTMDYSPVRLNIFFDQRTEEIKEVRCG